MACARLLVLESQHILQCEFLQQQIPLSLSVVASYCADVCLRTLLGALSFLHAAKPAKSLDMLLPFHCLTSVISLKLLVVSTGCGSEQHVLGRVY